MAVGFILNIPKENLDGFPVVTPRKLQIQAVESLNKQTLKH